MRAIVCLLIAVGLTVFVSRRRFYRRNVAGQEEFRNYWRMLATRLLEGFLRLIAIVLFVAAVGYGIVALQSPQSIWR